MKTLAHAIIIAIVLAALHLIAGTISLLARIMKRIHEEKN